MAQQFGFQTGQQAPQNMLDALAQTYAGPAAIPAIQRSEYLARALEQMQTNQPAIRSPLALGSNLLADAVLEFGRARANKDLLKQIQAGETAYQGNSVLGTGLPGDPSAMQPPMAAAGAPGAGSPPGGAAPAPSAPPPAPTNTDLAASLATAKNPRAAAIYATLTKGGLSPTAAAGMLGNFSQESGPNFGLDNPSEGAIGIANWRGPRAQAARDYFAGHGGPTPENQAGFVLSELHGPEAATLARLNAATDVPGAVAAGEGYERPAGYLPGGDPTKVSGYANRLAQAQGFAGQFAQSNTPSGPQSTATAAQPSPTPQPVQIATGPDPSVPSPQAQGPVGASGGQVAPPQPQMQGPPTGPQATPQERAIFEAGMHSPPGSLPWQRALALAQEIQKRAATPIELNKGEYFGPNGQAQSVHALQPVAGGAPNAFYQIDPVTHELKVTNNPAYGPVAGGAVMNGNGSVSPVPIAPMGGGQAAGPQGQGAPGGGSLWSEPFQVPGLAGLQVRNNLTGEIKSAGPSAAVNTPVPGGGNGAVWSQKPGEAPSLVQGPVTAEMVAQRGSQFNGLPEIAAAREGVGAVRAFDAAVGKIKPGGPVDQAAIDAYIRSISSPTAGVRQGPVQVFLEHQNLPDEIKGNLMRVFGQGFLTPAVLKQMGQVIWTNAHQRLVTAQGMDNDNRTWAQKAGFDPGSLGENLPQMADVPAYSQDDPRTLPPPAQRQVGMTAWGPKGPIVWTGHGWKPQ